MRLFYTGDFDFINSVHLWNNHKLKPMKTIFYPPQHITELGDMIYNAPTPERVVIDPVYLAADIGARLDDQEELELIVGHNDLSINVKFDCKWVDDKPADDSVGFRGTSIPCIYNIEIMAFYDGDEIEMIIDQQELVDAVFKEFS